MVRLTLCRRQRDATLFTGGWHAFVRKTRAVHVSAKPAGVDQLGVKSALVETSSQACRGGMRATEWHDHHGQAATRWAPALEFQAPVPIVSYATCRSPCALIGNSCFSEQNAMEQHRPLTRMLPGKFQPAFWFHDHEAALWVPP